MVVWVSLNDHHNYMQSVVANGSMTKCRSVMSGVPQKSVSGPMLLSIFALATWTLDQAHPQQFTDNTKLCGTVMLEGRDATQRDLDRLKRIKQEWNLILECRKKGIPQSKYLKNGFVDISEKNLDTCGKSPQLKKSHALSDGVNKEQNKFIFQLSGEQWMEEKDDEDKEEDDEDKEDEEDEDEEEEEEQEEEEVVVVPSAQFFTLCPFGNLCH
ncbi:hypothetical protein DUI87_03668 [Hirundo rustica rustica]|uniref:Reverse transcriptase domain-containing protein n=1 Tax=Hirundo rustica rustica TaxID=333673 RepID=A0A3M0L581_HIRRU|nr:hypothetical protein DUI87_03668 [Hirundo rustica rustica]